MVTEAVKVVKLLALEGFEALFESLCYFFAVIEVDCAVFQYLIGFMAFASDDNDIFGAGGQHCRFNGTSAVNFDSDTFEALDAGQNVGDDLLWVF